MKRSVFHALVHPNIAKVNTTSTYTQGTNSGLVGPAPAALQAFRQYATKVAQGYQSLLATEDPEASRRRGRAWEEGRPAVIRAAPRHQEGRAVAPAASRPGIRSAGASLKATR
ncbi:MAG: hypothetical protein U0931_26900 [Vulcanimicrobiota bacterium]